MEIQNLNDNFFYLVLVGTAGGFLLASSVVFFYIRYQRRFIKQQADIQQAELRHKQTLLNATIRSQEEERIRISKDLHDHVGSSLSGLRLMVSQIMAQGANAEAVKTIAANTKNSIDNIIEDVRGISHSLSPAGLELWGFHEALAEYCDKTGRLSGLHIKVSDATGGALKQMEFDHALSVFRVVQELVNNTIRHASAQNVTITISRLPQGIQLRYADDGKGMEQSSKSGHGIGMYNIESRLSMIEATYEVATAPGKGYNFAMNIPATLPGKKPQYG